MIVGRGWPLCSTPPLLGMISTEPAIRAVVEQTYPGAPPLSSRLQILLCRNYRTEISDHDSRAAAWENEAASFPGLSRYPCASTFPNYRSQALFGYLLDKTLPIRPIPWRVQWPFFSLPIVH